MSNQGLDKIKLDFANLLVLKDLLEKDKIDSIKSSTIYELKILESLSHSTVFRRIQYLEDCGLLKKGLKKSNKNTYYITKLGTEIVKNILKGENNYEK